MNLERTAALPAAAVELLVGHVPTTLADSHDAGPNVARNHARRVYQRIMEPVVVCDDRRVCDGTIKRRAQY